MKSTPLHKVAETLMIVPGTPDISQDKFATLEFCNKLMPAGETMRPEVAENFVKAFRMATGIPVDGHLADGLRDAAGESPKSKKTRTPTTL